MRRMAKTCAVLLLASVSLAGTALPAIACDYHRGSESARSPRAAEVIAAMRDPANAQALGNPSPVPKVINLVGFHQAMRKLQRLRESLERTANAQRPLSSGFSLLFAEAGLWTRFVLDEKGVKMEIDTTGPRISETVVTTGEEVIAAIASGQLSAREAYQRNMLFVDGAAGDTIDVSVWLRDALAALPERL
jgi:hypothetical protein